MEVTPPAPPPVKPIQDGLASLVGAGWVAAPWLLLATAGGMWWCLPFGLTAAVAFVLVVRRLASDPTDRLCAAAFLGPAISLLWCATVLFVHAAIGSILEWVR